MRVWHMQEFVEGPFSQSNLDPGASMLIPVPGPQGGVVVIGESVIAYVRKKRSADDRAVKSLQIFTTIIKVKLILMLARIVSAPRPFVGLVVCAFVSVHSFLLPFLRVYLFRVICSRRSYESDPPCTASGGSDQSIFNCSSLQAQSCLNCLF